MPDGPDHRATELRCLPAGLPDAALDDRLAIVGTTGSGKTYAAKGFVELLLNAGARVAIVDPLGVWWGLRAAADGIAPGYPVVVFGGRHADVPIDDRMGAALGRLIAGHALACVIDLSELGSAVVRKSPWSERLNFGAVPPSTQRRSFKTGTGRQRTGAAPRAPGAPTAPTGQQSAGGFPILPVARRTCAPGAALDDQRNALLGQRRRRWVDATDPRDRVGRCLTFGANAGRAALIYRLL